MNDGLQVWTAKDEGGGTVLLLGPDESGTRQLWLPTSQAAELAAEHNKQVTWARIKVAGEREGRERAATLDDVEALLVRVATATVRELLRSVRPWRRRSTRS